MTSAAPIAAVPVHGYYCPQCADHMLNLDRPRAPMFTVRSTCMGCRATYRIDMRTQLMESVEYRDGSD